MYVTVKVEHNQKKNASCKTASAEISLLYTPVMCNFLNSASNVNSVTQKRSFIQMQ